MTWLISKIVGNPMVLLVLLAAAFVTGVTVGSSAAWYIQSIRIDKAEAVHSRYAAEVEQNAIAAKRAALESFDFSFQPSLDRHRIAALAQLDFIRRAEVVHFLGPPDTTS